MTVEQGWVTWSEAAALVGCPVSTIDWHTRTGRITRRPRAGSRPTLERRSVEEFGSWWEAREAARLVRRAERERAAAVRERHRARAVELGIRPGRIPALTPDSTGWLTTAEAAALLEVSASTVTRLARAAGVRVERAGVRWWFDEADIVRLADERRAWISFADAAEIVGCSDTAIATAIADGLVNQRRAHRTKPSVERASVEKFAEIWRQRQQARAEHPRPASAPPDDEHVWLDTGTAAALLGVSRARVSQLVLAGRLPHERRGQRIWFRRDLLEVTAAARAMRKSRPARPW